MAAGRHGNVIVMTTYSSGEGLVIIRGLRMGERSARGMIFRWLLLMENRLLLTLAKVSTMKPV